MLSYFSVPGYDDGGAAAGPSSRSNKRAHLVCFRCHEKKIRCDLVHQSGDSNEKDSQCSSCTESGTTCQLRPSMRGKRRKAPNWNGFDRRQTAPEPSDEPPNSIFTTSDQPEPGSLAAGPANDRLLSLEEPSDITATTDVGHAHSRFPQVPSSAQETGTTGTAREVDPHSSPDKRRRYSSYLGDSGFMPIFSEESTGAAQPQILHALTVDYTPVGLQEGHIDVFFEYAYTWCPVLDRNTLEAEPSLRQSLLLRHALALCANQIKPSLLHRSSSTEHYNRAKELFNGNHEPNPLIRIMALMMFYWWSSEPPNVVNIDNTAWWTGIAIRVAQQIGMHREARSSCSRLAGDCRGLRRRIWWTLVARERITAISQDRPCIIDLDDCDVPMPTPNDFPEPHDIRITVFVHFIPLCEIIGRIGKVLQRRKPDDSGFAPIQLAHELVAWVQPLPLEVQPSFKASRTRGFHRDVHGMHLTYLCTITILHLSNDSQPLPKASVAGIVAASCTARIFHDFLVRGSISFLAGQAGWYISVAILALLYARKLDGLTADADADIATLRAALGAMSKDWRVAGMFGAGIEKLMRMENQRNSGVPQDPVPVIPDTTIPLQLADEMSATAGINWQDYFPYVTDETSPLINTLFAQYGQTVSFPELYWTLDVPTQVNQFLTGDESMLTLDFLSL